MGNRRRSGQARTPDDGDWIDPEDRRWLDDPERRSHLRDERHPDFERLRRLLRRQARRDARLTTWWYWTEYEADVFVNYVLFQIIRGLGDQELLSERVIRCFSAEARHPARVVIPDFDNRRKACEYAFTKLIGDDHREGVLTLEGMIDRDAELRNLVRAAGSLETFCHRLAVANPETAAWVAATTGDSRCTPRVAAAVMRLTTAAEGLHLLLVPACYLSDALDRDARVPVGRSAEKDLVDRLEEDEELVNLIAALMRIVSVRDDIPRAFRTQVRTLAKGMSTAEQAVAFERALQRLVLCVQTHRAEPWVQYVGRELNRRRASA
jgi:hypothetical protein